MFMLKKVKIRAEIIEIEVKLKVFLKLLVELEILQS